MRHFFSLSLVLAFVLTLGCAGSGDSQTPTAPGDFAASPTAGCPTYTTPNSCMGASDAGPNGSSLPCIWFPVFDPAYPVANCNDISILSKATSPFSPYTASKSINSLRSCNYGLQDQPDTQQCVYDVACQCQNPGSDLTFMFCSQLYTDCAAATKALSDVLPPGGSCVPGSDANFSGGCIYSGPTSPNQ